MAKGSIKKIAELTNLSPGTVSIVLNGRGDEMRIAKKTQQRIIDEARKIGYLPNIHARRLRKSSVDNETAVIGVMWPSRYSSDSLVRFFEGIQNSILYNKLNIEIIFKPYIFNELSKADDVFTNSLFNGVIVVGAANSDVEYLHSIRTLMPIVFFNRQDDRYSSVGTDDFAAGELVAKLFHLRGHKSVGMIVPNIYSRHFSLRTSGFTSACEYYNIESYSENIVTGEYDDIKDAAVKLVNSRNRPTAIYLVITSAAQDLYKVCKQKGLHIPEDVEIIGHVDTALCTLLNPTLSVIDFPVEEMVDRCLHLIVDMLRGEISQPLNILVKTNFIFRGSCGGFPEESLNQE